MIAWGWLALETGVVLNNASFSTGSFSLITGDQPKEEELGYIQIDYYIDKFTARQLLARSLRYIFAIFAIKCLG